MKIENYPFEFTLAGETWELSRNMIVRMKSDGEENKLSLSGNVTDIDFSETVNEYVVTVDNLDGTTFLMSKNYGWIGPFENVEAVDFDEKRGVALITGRRNGEDGVFDLTR